VNILSSINSYLNYKTKYFNGRINANFDQLLPFFENNVNFCRVNVIVLTETWHDIYNCTYSLPGFQIFYSKMKKNKNDGIIVSIKNNFSIDFNEYGNESANIINLKFVDRSCYN